MTNKLEDQELPFLGIRRRVLFPGLLLRLTIGRSKSVELAQSLWSGRTNTFRKNSLIFVTTFAPVEASETEFSHLELSSILDSERGDEESRVFYKRGTIAKVLQLAKVNGKDNANQFTMLIEGVGRAEFQEFSQSYPFYQAKVVSFPNFNASQLPMDKLKRIKALAITLRRSGSELSALMRRQASGKVRTLAKDVLARLEKADVDLLADLFASVSDSQLEEKQEILAESDLEKRLERALELVNRQIEIFRLSDRIQSNIDDKMKSSQREFYLKQQLKAIQGEINDISREKGEAPEDKTDVEELQEKIEQKALPDEVLKVATKELGRLKAMQPSQPEYSVIKTYLDVIVDLPWNEFTEDNLDVTNASQQLDNDHFGLEKVKKRILEFLAVMSLNALKDEDEIAPKCRKLNAPILCFVGPPGVGKTSLGKSIAKALNRQFARFSLGGVRDEAEIRGHRKTYIGALPGKILQIFKKVKTSNPLILLDEIDKVSSYSGNRQGDVSAALLEVLDPEQNDSFTDHYLNMPFDLSKTLFIATANDLSTIPGPLLDRMEIIEIPSYTAKEKVQIAKRYLIPKQVEKHSLDSTLLRFKTDGIEKLISNYTREAGIRSLERQVAAICRHEAVKQLNNREVMPRTPIMSVREGSSEADADSASELYKPKEFETNSDDVTVVDAQAVVNILGPELYETDAELNAYIKPCNDSNALSIPGVSIGLAYTRFGGDILFIEVAVHYGTGKVHLTGQLGNVMTESVNTAFSFIKANVGAIGLKQQFAKFGCDIHTLLKLLDVHVHFPAGAVPKDGPSAGVAICAAITSAISGVAIRSDTACTGEISLRGAVLPVGGIKEKVLAAHRAGMKRVLLPFRNEKDVREIPTEILDELEIIPVKAAFEALGHLFSANTEAGPPRWLFDFPSDTDLPIGTLPDSSRSELESDIFPKNNQLFSPKKHSDVAMHLLRSLL